MPELKPDEQDTKYNPAQELYEREFGSAAKEKTHTDAHGDTVQNNPNADVEKARNKEEEGDSGYFNNGKGVGKGSTLSGFFKGKGGKGKKFGPSGGIIALLIAGVGAGSALAIPASLLVMMERVFTNNGTHDVRANSMLAKGRLGGVFSADRDKNCATSKIKCKVSSMSKAEIKRWEKQPGVKIEKGRDFKGRTVVRAMTIEVPNGKPLTITNAAQFNEAMKNNSHFRSLNYRVQHPRATFFIGPDSKFRSILKKYKMNMGKTFSKVKPGSTKEERTKTFNSEVDKATGASSEGDSKGRVKARISKAKEKVKAAGAKFQSSVGGKVVKAVATPAGWASLGCTMYSLQKATLTTIKMSYYIDLIKFFHPFMKAAGQIINEGDVDPELIDYIGDRLTWYQPEATADTADKKSKINKTATDSQGFQAALYGDFGKLADFTKHYVPWWAISAATGRGVIQKVEDAAGGKQNINRFCYGAKMVSYLGLAGGGGAAFAVCELINVAADNACAKVVMSALQAIVDQTLDDVYERMESFVLDSDLKGVDLGNAIAAGVGLFLMEKSRGSGLKPAATTAAVSSYLSATEESYQQDVLAQKEDAQANPFDTSNQYSLASNLAMSVSQYKPEKTTGFSIAANFASVLTNSLLSFGKNNTAHAGYFQPIESVTDQKSLQSMTQEGNKDKSGRTCEDQDMNDIGVLCDWTGRSIDVVDTTPLKWAQQLENGDLTPWNATIDYMTKNGFIDADTGKPEKYDEEYNKDPDPDNYEEKKYDNEYLMYKAYCTNDRVYPLGTTMKPVDDSDTFGKNLAWFTGARCAGNDAGGVPDTEPGLQEKLNRFFFYYNMCETQIGVADENQKCWEDEPAATTTATDGSSGAAGESLKSDGEWGCPVDFSKGGVMTQPPHDVGNGTASGVDYNYGKNTPGPIYAVRDGTVTQAGPASGYGNWVMIEHEENGKKISSYYGHIANGGYFVKVGDKVTKGQHIADIGAGIVGLSSGPHVHAGLKMDPQATAADYQSRFMAACKK